MQFGTPFECRSSSRPRSNAETFSSTPGMFTRQLTHEIYIISAIIICFHNMYMPFFFFFYTPVKGKHLMQKVLDLGKSWNCGSHMERSVFGGVKKNNKKHNNNNNQKTF